MGDGGAGNCRMAGCVNEGSCYYSLYACLKFPVIKRYGQLASDPRRMSKLPDIAKRPSESSPCLPGHSVSSMPSLKDTLKTLVALHLSVHPPSPDWSHSIFRTQYRCHFLQDASTDYPGLGGVPCPEFTLISLISSLRSTHCVRMTCSLAGESRVCGYLSLFHLQSLAWRLLLTEGLNVWPNPHHCRSGCDVNVISLSLLYNQRGTYVLMWT